MKKYQIELTTTELQKLQIFLVMKEEDLRKEAIAYQELVAEAVTENKYFHSEKAIATFKSNEDWFFETYEVIHKIREKLDLIPF